MKALSLILAITSVVLFLVVTFIIKSHWIEQQIDKEEGLVNEIYGVDFGSKVKEKASNHYTYLFINTGIVDWTYQLFIPTEEERRRSKGIENLGKRMDPWITDIVKSFWLQIKQALYRIQLIGEWFYLFIPVIVASLFDGLMQRKVKQETYGYASAWKYRFGLNWLIISVILTLFYLTFPLTLEIAPFIPILFFIYISYFFNYVSSNIQKQV